MTYAILGDRDLDARVPMPAAIRALERALREHAAGRLVAPPRFAASGDRGSLVFIAGGTKGPGGALGCRAYATLGEDSPDHVQLVAVYDGFSGEWRASSWGTASVPRRTGAIGGVAVDRLARRDARRLAVLCLVRWPKPIPRLNPASLVRGLAAALRPRTAKGSSTAAALGKRR